ncbi:MAG: hypothetical protein BAJALOKI2v1_20037 [Promethearchaeota archaeon]|nr:MAG: hypothetical protein BAJALOKI2v1_20037 [Candidatus Lokiarchaeota archaeon]
MIFQGIFNILDIYFKEIDLFYIEIDTYFRKKLKESFQLNSDEIKEKNKKLDEFQIFIIEEFTDLGFQRDKMEYILTDPSLEVREEEHEKIVTAADIYEKKLSPVIHEIILEKFCEYIAGLDDGSIIVRLRDLGALPVEFLVEVRDLKIKLENNPEKLNNFQEYMKIKEKIIQKFVENKHEIESLEKLKETRKKLQLIYFIYRIINFFHMEKMFDFNPLETYLPEHTDDWLVTIPLVSLKNPDLFFCGLFLADNLTIDINENRVRGFVIDLWNNIKKQSDAPLFENTSDIYYCIKSFRIYGIDIKKEEIEELIEIDESYFRETYLKDLETSQLVVILKLLNLFGVLNEMNKEKINAISEEIDKRISKHGINQYRDGPLTSESTYYVVFGKYMRENLQEIEKINILEYLVPRIYRNLEILSFSGETNYDLFSETFYSCETLKLMSCIESREFLIQIIDFMLPSVVKEEIKKAESIKCEDKKFRSLKVDKNTGRTIYT